ncbi:hypothetical protein L218DRAFT_527184 [Marasmius fiardii PR-910]|nr:hypothetical protein L218DRAFT_527184 [Marasmius fiardii PR-910]
MEQRFLRILYSTNDSTQYVLARSRSLSPVYPLPAIPDDGHGTRTRYASVSIKACIDTLCLSSPDLIQDRTRDFSVYHLDPLESVGPTCNGSQSIETIGVPVGLGLMSGLRATDGNLPVTGTLTKLRTGLEALEVVFNLREVQASARPSLSESDKANIAAALARQKSEKEMDQKRTTRDSTDNRQKNRRLGHAAARCGVAETLLSGAGTYRTTSNKKHIKSEEPRSEPSTFDSPSPSTHTGASTSSSSQPSSSGLDSSVFSTSSASQMPTPPSSQPCSSPSEPCLVPSDSGPGSGSAFTASSSIPDTATLLAVLALIDDAGGPSKMEGNTQFQEAVKGLLAQFPQILSHSQLQVPSSNSNSHLSEDDEIVALDKENVNPEAFRKRARVSSEAVKSIESSTSTGSSQPSSNTVPDRPIQGLGLGGRSNTLPVDNSSHQSHSGASNDENRTSTTSRKGKEKAKDTIYHSLFASNSSSTSNISWSSPPRSRHSYGHGMENDDNDIAAIGTSRRTPIVIPDSPCTPKAKSSTSVSYRRIPASSPIRGNAKQNVATRKQYVVPEWARTTTATRPKFSDKYMKAMEDVSRQREEERKSKRRKPGGGIGRSKSTSALDSHSIEIDNDTGTGTNESEKRVPTTPPQSSSALPGPEIAAFFSQPLPTLGLPVCASSVSLPFLVPKTPPPRKRPRSPSQSPIIRSGSLFTPTSFNSPLFSPSPSRRARKIIRSDPVSPKSVPRDIQDKQENVDDDEDALTRELDSALDEITSTANPSLSAGENASTSCDDETPEEEGDTDTYPRKQYWAGLPPSSPPQSSPGPRHADLDDDDDNDLPSVDTPIGLGEDEEENQLPVVSSDAPEAAEDTGMCNGTPMNSDIMDADKKSDVSEDVGQQQQIIPFDVASTVVVTDSESEPATDDIFALFTNLNGGTDDSDPGPLGFDWNIPPPTTMMDVDLDPSLGVGLEDMDFTQFWESVKPLIDPNANGGLGLSFHAENQNLPVEQDGGLSLSALDSGVDHNKLADDLRSLYSGCVM